MALPKFFEFFRPYLKALSDGETRSPKEIREIIATDLQLSEEDLSILIPSGRCTYFADRTSWAKTYLHKAGLIECPVRAQYRLTEDGLRAYNSGENIDLAYLEQFPSFREFHSARHSGERTQTVQETVASLSEELSPQEMMIKAREQINADLKEQLLDLVINLSPTGFEVLVVRLLLAMGYGDGTEDAGRVTQRTNDGGIDGIIKEDKLGFGNIYIQAKRWNPDAVVDRPEIQKFVGALTGKQAQKGIFITTSRFSEGAKQFAANLLNMKVVLLDGEGLMGLMIQHNIGVSVEETYEVKRIDNDFFDDFD